MLIQKIHKIKNIFGSYPMSSISTITIAVPL